MVNKLKELFTGGADTDLSRRKFIRGAASLAALTVVAGSVPSLLKVKSIQDKIASGRIFSEVFYLTEGIVIDIPNVIIENCKFIITCDMDYAITLSKNANNTVVRDVYIDGGNHNIKAAFNVEGASNSQFSNLGLFS